MRWAALYRRPPILRGVSASQIRADHAANQARINARYGPALPSSPPEELWSPKSRPAGSLGQLQPSRHTPIDAWIQKIVADGDGGRRDLRIKNKPHQLRRLSVRWSSSSNDMPRDGFASKFRIATQSFCDTSSSSCRTDGSDP